MTDGGKNVRIKTLKTIAAALMLAVLLLAAVPAAYADDPHHDDAGYGPRGEGHGHHIQRIDIPVTVTDNSGTSTTYTVSNVAITGKHDKVAVITLDKPVTGAYNTSNDMGYMPTKEKAGLDIRVDSVDNSSLPASGASAILSVGKLNFEYKGRDYSIVEFRKLAVHLPDGTVKAYFFEKPVKVIKSRDRKVVITDAYPGYTRALKEAFTGNQTFSSAVPIKDLRNSEAGITEIIVEGPKPL